MTNPAKVVGFLDITGNWDRTLAFVMGGAVFVFGIGARVIGGLPAATSDPVSKSLVAGSILFGVGWGVSGFCPGPALASLATLRPEALWFVPAMAIGMIAAQQIFGVDR
jgi:uncharacterized membrane protein YedE/YeeE